MKVLKKYLLGILCLLFIGIMYSSLATASFGYEYLAPNNSTLHFWNDYDDYYINLSSGIQYTNVYPVYWTKNVWCVGITRNYESVYCDDKYRINMAIYTDNSSYINITGGYSIIAVIDGVSYHLQTNLKYHFKDTDQNLTIINSVKSLDNYSFTNNVYFYWKITNINISNNDYVDFLEVNRTRYYLDTNFSFNSSNLSSKKIFLGDDSTDESLWLTWNSLDYVGFFNQTVETVKINMGGVNASETETIIFNWLDDTCGWNCVMSQPSSTVSCNVGETFNMRGYWSGIGSCPETRVILAQKNVSGYSNITSIGNLSSTGTNPVVLPFFDFENPDSWQDWTVTCNNAGNYTVRVTCDGVATAKQNVNVIDPLSVGCPITNVGSSVTLTGLNQSCINISSNNMVFDCAGNKMNVSYMTGYNPFAFNINGYSNITIKNCNNIQNYNNGFILNNASNVTIFNNSFKNYYYKVVGGDTLYGVYIKNVSKLNFSNNIISNTSGTCTSTSGTGCLVSVYNMYYIGNYSVFFNNVFNGAVKYDENSIFPDTTIVKHVISYGNYNNWSNNVFKNYTGSNSNLFDLYGSNNVFVNNTFSFNPNTALYLDSGNYNIFNGLTMTNISTNGVYLLTSNNNSFNNVNISNSYTCFRLGFNYYNAECDCYVYYYVWNNTIMNSTLNCSSREILSIASSTNGNKFINVSLINDLLSGNMFTVENWAFVNVTNFQGVAFANVNVNISDKNNLTNNYSTTNASGIINSFLVMHYNGTTNFENHIVSANYTLSADYKSTNFSSSRVINLQATSCNYFSPYGNWVQNATQNCTVNYLTNMNNKNITCSYAGYVYIHNNISNTNIVYKNTNCIYVKWKNTTFS